MPTEKWTPCNCIKVSQEKILDHCKKRLQEGEMPKFTEVIAATFTNSAFIFSNTSNSLSLSMVNIVEVIGTKTNKKGESKPAKFVTHVKHNYCSICGKQLTDPDNK